MEKQSSNVADSNLSEEESASNYFFFSWISRILNTDQGMDFLFEKIGTVFKSEKVDEAYLSFKRTDQMDISDYYILEYDHLYQKNDTVCYETSESHSYSQLDCARVTDDKRKLALTMSSNINFEDMKSWLARLFVSHPIYHKHDDIQIKP